MEKCLNCGKEIIKVRNISTQKFCSYKCQIEFNERKRLLLKNNKTKTKGLNRGLG